MDQTTETQILACITRLDAILATPVFTPEQSKNVFKQSAFIESIILLRDLMHKSEKLGRRISFVDDVNASEDVKDISDAIRYVRNAACHLDSDNRIATPGLNMAFTTCYGVGKLVKTPDGDIGADYADDVCFFYGTQKLYLRRHIVRAYMEARSYLRSLSIVVDMVCRSSDSKFLRPHATT